jgi:transposase
VLLWDNATYHTSAETMRVISRLGLQVIYSGPYSYSAAPVETLFSALKFRELNTELLPTGKR